MIKKITPREILTRVDWREASACRDEDPELFFSVGKAGPALSEIEQARSVCRGCVAIGYCALYALDTGQDFGVWGGTNQDERRALRRQKGFDSTTFAQGLQDGFAAAHPDAELLPPIDRPEPPSPPSGLTTDTEPQYAQR
ncbi:MAG TPA: WhiB family transcriptional regulator [Candidatus Saccharimonadales bacterium]|nr:WhiB family transcriptional regulator [Candidatus Saccharimonadales bacterium]